MILDGFNFAFVQRHLSEKGCSFLLEITGGKPVFSYESLKVNPIRQFLLESLNVPVHVRAFEFEATLTVHSIVYNIQIKIDLQWKLTGLNCRKFSQLSDDPSFKVCNLS